MEPPGYDGAGARYEKVRSAHQDIQKLLVEFLAPNSRASHVDLACGTCAETGGIAQDFDRFVGVDSALGMLRTARRACQGLFIAASLEGGIPLASESFDSVSMIAGVHHIANIEGLVDEIYRVLKHAGKALIITNSLDQIRGRSVYRYFPGTLEYNLRRFAKAQSLPSRLQDRGFVAVATDIIAREKVLFDRARLSRLRSGVLDSAFWCLSDAAWKEGLVRVEDALTNGERIEHCRDRLAICGIKP